MKYAFKTFSNAITNSPIFQHPRKHINKTASRNYSNDFHHFKNKISILEVKGYYGQPVTKV
jgi:hypothetical protein